MPPRLRRSDCSAPRIQRRRAGRGFCYYDAGGNRVTDPEVLERIKALVLLPAGTRCGSAPTRGATSRPRGSTPRDGARTAITTCGGSTATAKRRRGGPADLLVWKDGRRWVDMRSADINTYVKECTGGDLSAKDSRTWNATVLAAMALAVSVGVTSESGRTGAVTRAVKEMAHYLGNTPAVCRSSYIDPRVVDRFREGKRISPALKVLGEAPGGHHEPAGSLLTQGAIEAAVLDLLDDRDTVEEAA